MKNNLLTTAFLFIIFVVQPFSANAEVAKWLQNGAPVSIYDNSFNSDKYFPAITGAGNDNAFIAWQDYRDDPMSGNIYVQKVDVSGTPVFKNSSGIITDRKATVDSSSDKRFPGIIKDGSGNAFVVWEDYRNGDNNIDIHIQKINNNGIPLWASDKIICNYSGNQRFPQIILSNTSPVEAIVVWEDYRNSTYSQIYAQKIDINGNPKWTSNGIPVASTTTNQRAPAIASDSSDGAIIVWSDWRNISTTGLDIYGQRVYSDGAGQWSSAQMVITGFNEDQMFPAIAGDGVGNYIVTWEDYRTGIYTGDIYAKGIDGSGSPLFPDQDICSAKDAGNNAADQRYPRVAYSTSDNGFIILWEDYRNDPANYTADIYAQKVANDGTVRWTTINGVQVAKIEGTTQDAVAVASLDTKGVIATWEDYRSNSVYDIYATPLPLPGSISIAGGASNTVSSNVTLNLWASSFGAGPLEMRFSNDNSTWSSWEPYSTTKAGYSLAGNSGTNTVYVQFRDSSTPVQYSPVYSDSITLVNLTINSGADYTNNEAVTLSLAGSNCQMEFSNDNSTWSGYEACASSKSWTVSSSDGLKTVYVHLRDNTTLTVATSSDTVTLDKTAPALGSTYPVNNAIGVSLNPSVTIPFNDNYGIDGSTIIAANIYLKQGSTLMASTLSYSSATSTATLTPTNKLSINTTYTVYVTGVKDIAGNSISPDPYSFSFTTIADNTPPTGTVIINNNDVYTNNLTVNLTISATDDLNGVSQMRFSSDESSWKTWQSYKTTAAFDFSSGYGIKSVYVQFQDGVGNISSLAYHDDITLDMTSPTGTIAINYSATYTNSASVALTLSCSDTNDCSQMQFSNDNATWSTAENYAVSKAWTLATGDGTKTVYVKFKDNAGNWSDLYNATIILDTTPPTGTIAINSGATYTNSASVALNLSCSDTNGCSQMQFSNDNATWSTVESYAASKMWTLVNGDGTKTVYVKFKDNAGNWSNAYSSTTIVLDTTLPTGTISINSGATYTNSTSVVLTLSCTDNNGCSQMQFSNENSTWSTVESYAASKAWTLANNDGTKTVYVKFKDNAGNWSNAYNNIIILDTTAPGGGSGVTPSISLDVATGQTYSYSKVVASWTSFSDPIAGLKEYMIAVGTTLGGTDILNWTSTGVPSYTTGDISIDNFGKTLYVSIKAVDLLGNESSLINSSFVYTPGDINSKGGNGDGRIDGFDLGMLGIAFGSTTGGVADINRDGNVDGVDLTIIGANFGKAKP